MIDAEIERYNRRELWRDAANHLRVAHEALEHVQGVLEDLDVPHISSGLVEPTESVKRFMDLADRKVEEGE